MYRNGTDPRTTTAAASTTASNISPINVENIIAQDAAMRQNEINTADLQRRIQSGEVQSQNPYISGTVDYPPTSFLSKNSPGAPNAQFMGDRMSQNFHNQLIAEELLGAGAAGIAQGIRAARTAKTAAAYKEQLSKFVDPKILNALENEGKNLKELGVGDFTKKREQMVTDVYGEYGTSPLSASEKHFLETGRKQSTLGSYNLPDKNLREVLDSKDRAAWRASGMEGLSDEMASEYIEREVRKEFPEDRISREIAKNEANIEDYQRRVNELNPRGAVQASKDVFRPYTSTSMSPNVIELKDAIYNNEMAGNPSFDFKFEKQMYQPSKTFPVSLNRYGGTREDGLPKYGYGSWQGYSGENPTYLHGLRSDNVVTENSTSLFGGAGKEASKGAGKSFGNTALQAVGVGMEIAGNIKKSNDEMKAFKSAKQSNFNYDVLNAKNKAAALENSRYHSGYTYGTPTYEMGGELPKYQNGTPNYYDTSEQLNKEMPWKKTNAFDKTDFFSREEKLDMMNNPSTPRYISSGDPKIENKLSNVLDPGGVDSPGGAVNMYNYYEQDKLRKEGESAYPRNLQQEAAIAERKRRTDAMNARAASTFEKTKRFLPKEKRAYQNLTQRDLDVAFPPGSIPKTPYPGSLPKKQTGGEMSYAPEMNAVQQENPYSYSQGANNLTVNELKSEQVAENVSEGIGTALGAAVPVFGVIDQALGGVRSLMGEEEGRLKSGEKVSVYDHGAKAAVGSLTTPFYENVADHAAKGDYGRAALSMIGVGKIFDAVDAVADSAQYESEQKQFARERATSKGGTSAKNFMGRKEQSLRSVEGGIATPRGLQEKAEYNMGEAKYGGTMKDLYRKGGYLPQYRYGGMSVTKGVTRPKANAEVEKDEIIMRDGGPDELVVGATHEKGGVPEVLNEGDYVWSDHLTYKGRSMAQLYATAVKNGATPQEIDQLKMLQEKLAGRAGNPQESKDMMAPPDVPMGKYGGMMEYGKGGRPGLWANIHAKRARGESPAKPGDKEYPKTLNIAKYGGSLPKYTTGGIKGELSGFKRWTNSGGHIPWIQGAAAIGASITAGLTEREDVEIRKPQIIKADRIRNDRVSPREGLAENQRNYVKRFEAAQQKGYGTGLEASAQLAYNDKIAADSKVRAEANRVNLAASISENTENAKNKLSADRENAAAVDRYNVRLEEEDRAQDAFLRQRRQATIDPILTGVKNIVQTGINKQEIRAIGEGAGTNERGAGWSEVLARQRILADNPTITKEEMDKALNADAAAYNKKYGLEIK